jgi:MtrB/PioB family decaheme-associated outer membrane protein
MKNTHFVLRRSSIAIAVALAFPAGAALADEVQDLTNPNTSDVSIHVQDLNRVNPLYRYYSGINQSGADYSVDANVVNRDANGDWLKIQARDLGIPGIQEFGISYEKQGDWRVGLDYNEITKYSPYTINTKVGGVGSGSLNLNQDFMSYQGLGPESSLSLERTATTLSASKFLSDNFKFNFSIKNENKSGEIMSGSEAGSRTGLTTANTNGAVTPVNSAITGLAYATQYFAPQPEDYKHSQISASVDYFTKTFQLSAGYYGSFFTNANHALNITPGADGSLSAITNPTSAVYSTMAASSVPWISMPPDNHFQQLYVDGAYSFSDRTHANFKLTTGQTVQNSPFIPGISAGPGGVGVFNPTGVIYAPGITNGNLGGEVDTTSAAVNVTSRLAKDLDLLASWRYENRNDKTPQLAYTTGAYNVQNSEKTNNGKLELGYRLAEGYRLTGSFKYDETETPPPLLPADNETTWRDQVHENTLSVALRKSMSETLNGSVTLAHASRTGGAWSLAPVGLLPTSGATFPTATNVTSPLQWGDRTRDTVKLMVDWNPIAPLSLQAYYEYGNDKYPSTLVGPAQTQVPGYALTQMGLLNGKTGLVGLDAAYAINKNWKANAFFTYSQNKTSQAEEQTARGSVPQTCADTSAAFSCTPWTADLNLSGAVVGAGVNGTMGSWILRAKYLYEKDFTSYKIGYTDIGVYSQVPVNSGPLPDTSYTTNRLQLSAVYPYSKTTTLRFDYIYDVQDISDYTWAGWTFSDGTRVNQSPHQVTQAIGVTLTQAF